MRNVCGSTCHGSRATVWPTAEADTPQQGWEAGRGRGRRVWAAPVQTPAKGRATANQLLPALGGGVPSRTFKGKGADAGETVGAERSLAETFISNIKGRSSCPDPLSLADWFMEFPDEGHR